MERKFYKALICTALLFGTGNILSSQVALSFDTYFKTDNIYCSEIVLQCENSSELEIGTSSFYIEYNKEALRFLSYKSESYDSRNKCSAQTEPAYTNHSFDVSNPGVINTTIFLKRHNDACPKLSDSPNKLATVCFEIKQPDQKSHLKYNEKHTHIDKAGLKVELLENLIFTDANESLKRNKSDTSKSE